VVCNHMIEIVQGESDTYSGNCSAYLPQRMERMEKRVKEYQLQQKEISRQEEIIARYRRFNREKSIKSAESREKQLEKIERLDRPQEEKRIRFSFHAKKRSGKDVLRVENLSKSFDHKQLFENIDLDIKRGQRLAILGPNGIGKTTFFRCILHELTPDTGTITIGSNVSIGYYDQKQDHLHPNKTVLDEVWDEFPFLDQTEIRNVLGLFLFTGDDVFQLIKTLSGGEKGRVALAKLMVKEDNLLLLDEPTNHLDMDSREILEEALQTYDGTILAISHDRYFINRFSSHIGYMNHDSLTVYQGNYNDYLRFEQQEKEDTLALPEKTKTAIEKEKRKQRLEKKEIKELHEKAKQSEEAIIKKELLLKEFEEQLSDGELYKNPEESIKITFAYEKAREELSALYQSWEEALSAIEENKNTLDH
ncbi:MAG: ABC-F family ATP-binding cassette domain-containing protein, partial [Clostridiales bacterium]|nr:ABC-F family ATP-binding cassette domain-containing protein [Clostridiales bacterium]